jgi:hypothetical protein
VIVFVLAPMAAFGNLIGMQVARAGLLAIRVTAAVLEAKKKREAARAASATEGDPPDGPEPSGP